MTEGIFGQYFTLTNENSQIYGNKTVVLLQVGSFFEVYGVRHKTTKTISGSLIEDVGEICQLKLAEKNATYKDKDGEHEGDIVMAGFQVYLLDKYVSKLIEAGYVVPVYTQQQQLHNDKTITRTLDRVYSAGTYLSCDTDSQVQMTNYIMSIWFFIGRSHQLIYGMSVIDIFTGTSFLFETSVLAATTSLTSTMFDELERYVSVYKPSEIIILSPFTNVDIEKVIQYSNIQCATLHRVSTLTDKKALRCAQQRYVSEIISMLFTTTTYESCNEFRELEIACQSFCYLVEFIREHTPNLVSKIAIPDFINKVTRVQLANHTLKQLNVIPSENDKDCALSFLNKCCSPMGKRLLIKQVTSPTFDEEWLQKEYDATKQLLLPEHYGQVAHYRSELRQIRDMDKLCRQLVTRNIYPSSIYHLYQSLCIVSKIQDANDNETVMKIQVDSSTILQWLNQYLDLNKCKHLHSMNTFDEQIIQSGISAELDAATADWQRNIDNFHTIKQGLNAFIKTKGGDTEFIKVHETDKSGTVLQITAKRSTLLKEAMPAHFVLGNSGGISCAKEDIKFIKTSSSSSTVTISMPPLDKICKELLILKEKINDLTAATYRDMLTKLE